LTGLLIRAILAGMRAILAGIFVFVGLLVCVALVFHYFPDGFGPAWLMGGFFAAVLFALVGIAQFVFNRPGERPTWKSGDEQLADLEAKGLLVTETFRATRAFQVEEFEDEGLHYFIELSDQSVLCLNGQYLYDYAEITDDAEINQPRSFPSTEFTLRRHKTAGYVVDIKITGAALPLDCLAPSFDKSDFRQDLLPEDGQIFRDRTYDDLRLERLKGTAGLPPS